MTCSRNLRVGWVTSQVLSVHLKQTDRNLSFGTLRFQITEEGEVSPHPPELKPPDSELVTILSPHSFLPYSISRGHKESTCRPAAPQP